MWSLFMYNLGLSTTVPFYLYEDLLIETLQLLDFLSNPISS